jgi:hypothetical protein
LAGARWPIDHVAFVVDNEAPEPIEDIGAQDAFVRVAAGAQTAQADRLSSALFVHLRMDIFTVKMAISAAC